MTTPRLTRLLRTLRFDGSDEFVFDQAAEPGEWAVSGAFTFADVAPDHLSGKPRQAFSNGFLGTTSFGWSTFATVGEATQDEHFAIVDALSTHFVANFGAPSIDAARPAAEHEIAFIADLVKDAPINTVFTVRRTFDDDGQLKESFRTITPPTDEPLHARIWTIDHNEA